MTTHTSVEIDLTVETTEQALDAQAVASEHGVTLDMIEAQGPGGGWPVYRASGTPENMKRYLKIVGHEEADG